ncbi:Hint domain-containing protein [Lutimaribacter marinistellae]|uniref:Hint domain-containing protein n=1 Tax=Lutimaribacter marinistellae TaxID=1820329 RepID=A0ABV7TD53_9RHOB
MGYNISDVGGEATGGVDVWEATLDLNLSGATTVSGDFDVVPLIGGGGSIGDATNGYVFSGLSNPALGTLSTNSTTGEYTFTADWSAILATGSDQVVSFTVTGTSGGNSDTDTVNINLLICVARGTRVETTNGPVAVEDLSVGDLVVTLHGDVEPVRWIGSRKLGAAELAADPSKRPIRFARGSLGPNVPRRPLRVSPQHRMFLEDWRAQLMFGEERVLLPAKSLVNDKTIRRVDSAKEVEYFHILFDTHQIILTEGAPTESFHPGAYTLGELDAAAREELLSLFPELEHADSYGDTAAVTLRTWEGKLLSGAIRRKSAA